MSVIDKLKEDFRPQLTELKSWHCEAIDETFYYRPVANAAQTDKYLPLISEGKIEGYVNLVMERALNENGRKIFAPKDKATLLKDVDPKILVELGNIILTVDEDNIEAAQKEQKEIEKKS